MNIGALPELILSWFKGQGMEQLPTGKELALEQFKPGTQYEGKVLDSLPNGRHLVQIGRQALDMALPQQARAGDVVRLTFLNAAPRPTFVLNAPPVGNAQPVNVSSAAQQINALVRYVPVTASTPVPRAAATVSLSSPTAVQVPAGPAPATASALPAVATSQPAPVPVAQTTPPPAAGAPSTAGATAIPAPALSPAPPASLPSSNGVSTPSQSAASVSAGRPIIANPAVLLAPSPATAAPASALPGPAIPAMTMAGEAVDGARAALGSQSSLVTAQGVVAEKAAMSQVLPMRLQQTVKESGMFYESHLGKWVRGEMALETIQREPQARLLQAPGPRLDLPDLEGMPEQAARLASRQLHMLEGGPLVWQGQVWPGQEAEWRVQERDRERAEDVAAGQKWHSQLRLTLPRLGEVAANLDVGAMGLRVRLAAGSPATLAEMNAAMPELVQRLRSAELNLSSVLAELADADQ